MSPTRITRSIAAATLAAVGLGLALAQPAQAAGQDGVANNNEFILYYNSNKAGSISDFLTPQATFIGHTFIKPGFNGYGQSVIANTASVDNRKGDVARIYTRTNYAGTYDTVAAETWRNLNTAYNTNFSFRWL